MLKQFVFCQVLKVQARDYLVRYVYAIYIYRYTYTRHHY